MTIHGYSKENMKQAAEETKQTLGIPVGATYTATVLEFFGGLFLIIGLIVPIIGLFFALFMIANVIMKKRRMNAACIAPGRASYEIDITYLILSIILIVLGAGAGITSSHIIDQNESGYTFDEIADNIDQIMV